METIGNKGNTSTEKNTEVSAYSEPDTEDSRWACAFMAILPMFIIALFFS